MALAPFYRSPLCHWVCIYQNAVFVLFVFFFLFCFLYINRLRLNDWRASPWPVKLRWLWKIIHKMAGFSLLVIEHSVSACSEASFEWAAIESSPDANVSIMTGPDVCSIHFISMAMCSSSFLFFVTNTLFFLHWQMLTALELKNSNTWRTLFTR